MEYAALAIAVAALFVAFAARAQAARLARSVEDADADSRRRAGNANSEREREIEFLRKSLARIARGETVDADAILEGRTWREVSTPEGVALVTAGRVHLVDVRTRGEMAGGIIPGALLIPVDELEARHREIPRDEKEVLVYCASGGRSAAACEFLSQSGFETLANLAGGFSSWTGPKARP